MQEQNYSFEELKAELLERLEARGCTPITITGYRTSVTAFLPGLKKTVMAAIAKKEALHFYWIITANMEAISITMP